MKRQPIGRRLILAEYKSIERSGQLGKVNVVRTITLRLGYDLDVNNSNAYVRRALKSAGLI